MGGAFEAVRRTIFSVQGALAGIGVGLAIRKVVSEFAEFERGLIGVGKTTDITGRQLQDLGRGIDDIARRVPVATEQLLGIAQAAGQLGVTGQADILRFTETVGKLGLASDLAGEEAASSLARILTVTGTAISDVDRLASTIVDLGNKFAATESEITAVATRVSQSTAQFGITADQVAGISAALRAVGVEAESGGSTIGRAFQAINDALRQGGEEMAALQAITGQTGEALRDAFFEGRATEVFQSFVDGLGNIQKSGGDVAAALEAMDLEGVRVIQVLGTLATRSEVLGRTLGVASDEFENNTALTQEALRAAESFSSQMVLLGNEIDQVARDIGAALAPEIVTAAGHFRDFIAEARETGELSRFVDDLAQSVSGLGDAAADATAEVAKIAPFFAAGAAAATIPGGPFVKGGAALVAFVTTMEAMRTEAEKLQTELQGVEGLLADLERGGQTSVVTRGERQTLVELQARAASLRAELAALGAAFDEGIGDELPEAFERTATATDKATDAAKGYAGAVGDLGGKTKAQIATQKAFEKELDRVIAGFDKAEEAISAQIKSLQFEQEQLGRTERERFIHNELLKAEEAARKGSIEVTQEQVDLIREEAGALFDLNKKQERSDRARDEATRAQERQAEEAERLLRQPFENFIESTQRATADMFEDVFSGGVNSFSDLFDTVKRLGIRFAAEMAALLVFRPSVVAGAGSALGIPGFGGGGSLFGGGQSFTQTTNSAGQTVFVPSPPVGSLFSGVTNSINSFGASIGFGAGPEALAAGLTLNPGTTTGPLSAFGGAGPAVGGELTSATLTSVLGAAGIGAAIAGLGASLFGAGPEAQLGASLGGGLGAGIGFAAGGPLGAVLGGVIGGSGGGLLGSLFGSKPSVGPNAFAALNVSGGRFGLGRGAADNGGDLGSVQSAIRTIAGQLNDLLDTLGATGVTGFSDATLTNFPSQGGIQSFVAGFGGRRSFGGDSAAGIEDLIVRTLKDIQLEGVPDAVNIALRNSAETDLQEFLADIEFAQQLGQLADGLAATADTLVRIQVEARSAAREQFTAVREFRDRASRLGLTEQAAGAVEQAVDALLGFSEEQAEQLTEAEKALAAIQGRFEGIAEVAGEFGISVARLAEEQAKLEAGLTEGFEEGIAAQILAITDPAQRALDALAEAQEKRVREAEALGADLVAVERLNALERQRTIEQLAGQTGGGLSRFLEQLTFGGISGASPGASLTGLRATFEATAAQALAGDITARGRIEDLGRSLLEQSRSFNASGAGFQSDLGLVRGAVSSLIPANGNDSSAVVEAVNVSGAENVRLLADLIDQVAILNVRIAELQQTNEEQALELRRIRNAA